MPIHEATPIPPQRKPSGRAVAPAVPAAPQTVDAAQHLLGNQALARAASGDAPPGAIVQRSAAPAHAPGCGCPACASAGAVSAIVQRLPAHSAPSLQRAPAFDTARFVPASPPLAQIRPILANGRVVQRHASWEHRALGDIPPDKLAQLGAWQNVIDDLERGKDQPSDEEAPLLADEQPVDVAGAEIARDQILHVIQQEINRLKVWQDPGFRPRSAGPGAADKLKQDINDPEWQLHLVEIPNQQDPNDPLVVTYGELNTLADFYGSVEELIRSEPKARANVVQSVRKQTFEQLLKIYMRLKGMESQGAATKELGVEQLGFEGSFNITDAISGEVAQMMVNKKGQAVNKKGLIFDDKEETFSYGATLARNACHFAPESWHAWATLHREARASAKESYLKRQEAFDLEWQYVFQQMPPEVEKRIAQLRAEAQAAANMALLRNGFGDHYLQDSYASGHLINKTQVMQWFVEYLDSHPEKWTYTAETSWRELQGMAYNQPGIADPRQYSMGNVGKRYVTGATGQEEAVSSARNPQTVENTQGQANIGWEQRFEMLGLKMPGSIRANTPALTLLLYMQEHSSMLTEWTWKELKEKLKAPGSGFFAKAKAAFSSPQLQLRDEAELKVALKSLIDDNIVFMATGSRRTMPSSKQSASGEDVGLFQDQSTFELRKEYVPSVIGGGNFKLAAGDAKQGNTARFEKMVKATVYKDYVKFMRDGFIQKSTNALHDHYCIRGLPVYTGANEEIGHVYGDMHMLDRDSAKGVAHSATTANMSRDSIIQIINSGLEDNGHSTDDILKRLPQKVRVSEVGAPIGLDEWHTNPALLRKTTEDQVFSTLVSAKEFFVGMTSGKGLGKITKDEDVHAGEAF